MHYKGIANMFASDSIGADVILFGHTHEPFINYCNGKWISNPGRIGRVSSNVIHATYGVLIIKAGNMEWRIKEANKSQI